MRGVSRRRGYPGWFTTSHMKKVDRMSGQPCTGIKPARVAARNARFAVESAVTSAEPFAFPSRRHASSEALVASPWFSAQRFTCAAARASAAGRALRKPGNAAACGRTAKRACAGRHVRPRFAMQSKLRSPSLSFQRTVFASHSSAEACAAFISRGSVADVWSPERPHLRPPRSGELEARAATASSVACGTKHRGGAQRDTARTSVSGYVKDQGHHSSADAMRSMFFCASCLHVRTQVRCAEKATSASKDSDATATSAVGTVKAISASSKPVRGHIADPC